MPELTTIQQIAVWIIPVLFAITLHEAAHALVADKLGDSTARMLGRVSFNPLRHIDLIGTILIPILVLVLSQFNFVFGWAKPVPINASHFRRPRRDMALATAAGPLANLLMALFWAGCFKLASLFHPQSMVGLFFLLVSRAGLLINLLLAFFNLLPIPPLDGGRVAISLLPYKAAIQLQKVEPFGFFILLALMMLGALGWIINPLIHAALSVLAFVFRL
ncbi:site-2 protease family protein [Legionella sp. MW5194]|uniref:site-2 protease family protein n=1 Tax=Legionella sp. MW5194 TaxID=2662448 RepID=UPI00193DC668|nr:site-2 protease family protein [Legionella sp. MW5194]QRN04297.1 site-2 protease family protein [Legionella sp. MW5194]